MAVTQFEATEVVSRANVNQRINQINAYFPVSVANGGTGAATATGARTNLEVLKAYSLYDNASGTQSTIALSDSAANYDYLEIYYKDNDSEYACNKVYSPNGKSTLLVTVKTASSATRTWVKSAKVNISGDSITFSADRGQTGIFNNEVSQINTDLLIWIYKIIGYSY